MPYGRITRVIFDPSKYDAMMAVAKSIDFSGWSGLRLLTVTRVAEEEPDGPLEGVVQRPGQLSH